MKTIANLRVAAIVVCGVLALSVAGCLQGSSSTVVTYDKARDQFSVLMVYKHIRGDASELNGLLSLYRNRDHLILLPTIQIFSEMQTLKISDDLAAEINMGSPMGDIQAFHSPIPLGAIQIQPGELFLNGSNDLCYDHQVIIPGSVADDGVKWLNDYVRSPERGTENSGSFFGAYVALDAELAKRAAGTERMSWKEFTTRCIAETLNSMDRTPEKSVAQTEPVANGNPDTRPVTQRGDPFFVFDTASLQGLRHAAEQGHIVFSRNGAEFSIRLPLSADDIAGAMSFFTEFRQALRDKAVQMATAKSKDAETAQVVVDALNSTTVSAFDQSDIQVSVDVAKFFKIFHEPSDLLSDLPADDQSNAAQFAALAARQLTLDRMLTADQVKLEFMAGQFTPHPQVPPVAPGAGLGEIKPPEQ